MAAPADHHHLANILAARQILRTSLNKSKEISTAIEEAGPRLKNTTLRVASLETTIKSLASKCALYGIGSHINGAIGPADSVLKIFDLVCNLQNSLLTSSTSDLLSYLNTIDRIEEAVRLLGDSCKLLIIWLEDALHFLEERRPICNIAGDGQGNGECDLYITKVKKCIHILRELEAVEKNFNLKGGILMEALNNLENEFGKLLLLPEKTSLITASINASIKDAGNDDDDHVIISYPNSYPVIVKDKIGTIIDRLTANGRIEKCLSIYVEIRSSIVRTAAQLLEADYLGTSLTESDSVQVVQGSIDQWCKHMQIFVKYMLGEEYRLCGEVIGKVESDDVWKDCFAKIVLQSGFYCDFIEFGKMITKAKKDAIKLLKLLDVFSALNKLRLEFNRLFSSKGKNCLQIQAQTRGLINDVINVACDIFWELAIQIESQRQTTPPLDCSVPRIVRFVTDFCNLLLEDERRKVLVQILEIHQGWNYREFKEGLVFNQVQYIIKELELNLEAWEKVYEDVTMSRFFTMNCCWSLWKSINGTKLGDLMGKEWLKGYVEKTESHMATYLEECWEKLPSFLKEEDLILFPGGRAVDHKLARKRLKEFIRAFEETRRKQSSWVLSDNDLRLKVHMLISQVIVPPYNEYLRRYTPVMAGDHEEDTVSKLTESLEQMISSLFQPKLRKNGSTKCTGLDIKISNNPVFSSSPATTRIAGGRHFPSSTAAA